MVVSPSPLPPPALWVIYSVPGCRALCILKSASTITVEWRKRNSLLLLSAMLASVKTAACDGKSPAAELTPVIPECLTRCIIHECFIFKSILRKIYTLYHQFNSSRGKTEHTVSWLSGRGT